MESKFFSTSSKPFLPRALPAYPNLSWLPPYRPRSPAMLNAAQLSKSALLTVAPTLPLEMLFPLCRLLDLLQHHVTSSVKPTCSHEEESTASALVISQRLVYLYYSTDDIAAFDDMPVSPAGK